MSRVWLRIAVAFAITVALCVIVFLSAPAFAGGRTPSCLEQQYALRSMGYAVKVDGTCGATETKATKHLQRASGLEVDGIMGPITWGALQSAVRLTPPSPTPSAGPPVPEPGDAATARALRIEFGLPDIFDIYSKRESGNDNTQVSSTGCCVGLWQIHTGNFTAPGYKAGIAACGVTKRSDILGPTIEQWRANACVAAVLYRVSGLTPWHL